MARDYAALRDAYADIRGRAQNIVDAAKAAGRALTAEETAEYERLCGELRVTDRMAEEAREEEIAELRAQIIHPANASRVDGGGESWRDLRTGETIRALAPNERMSTTRADTASELEVGGYLRALITGDNRFCAERFRASMSEGTDSAGGYLVPAPLANEIIDLARSRSVLLKAGARTIPMSSKTLDIARITTDATSEWLAENASGTVTDLAFDRVTLSAKTLRSYLTLSIELAEDAPNSDSLLASTLAGNLAEELDGAGIIGNNASGTGIVGLAYLDINETVFNASGTAPTNQTWLPKVSTVVKTIREANVEPTAYLCSPQVYHQWGDLQDSTYQPQQIPKHLDLPQLHTTGIPTTLSASGTVSASGTFSAMYAGHFPSMLIGIRREMRLEVSRTAGDSFIKGQVMVRAYLRADMQVERLTHFGRLIAIGTGA